MVEWYECQIRSYHVEYTASHQNCEVKRHWACLVLRWGTTWEQYGAVSIFCTFAFYLHLLTYEEQLMAIVLV